MASEMENPEPGTAPQATGRNESSGQQLLDVQTNPDQVSRQEPINIAPPAETPSLRADEVQEVNAPEPLGTATEVRRLATLAPLDYDREREAAAKRLGVRLATLDAEVERTRSLRPNERQVEPDGIVTSVEPWPEPVEGSKLLDQLTATLRRFAVLPEKAAEAIALWIVFTHSGEAAEHSPILNVSSPEKRCGKTRLLAIVAQLVSQGLPTANITSAALFRIIEGFHPTLLVDEADTFLGLTEDMRGILNSGFDRTSAYVIRCDGDDHEPRRFSTWCPKLIAGIGHLPDTLRDRSITVSLRRKLSSEHVERFHRGHHHELHELRSMAKRWAIDELERLCGADPEMPPGLNDRAEDAWRSLFAIADTAGGHWPATARSTALRLSGVRPDDDEHASAGIQLLGHIREIFAAAKQPRLSSTKLVRQLCAPEEWPWGEWRHGKPLTPRGLARILKPFGIVPHHWANERGYTLDAFADAWQRYLSPAFERSSVITRHPSRKSCNINEEMHSADAQTCVTSGVR